VQADLRRALKESPGRAQAAEIKTLHLGPKTVLVALTMTREGAMTAAELEGSLKEVEKRVRAVDSRIRFVYFRFD
jgi:hypothetical protein